jgi:LPXTG-site transpeptidase (sortase) family protein
MATSKRKTPKKTQPKLRKTAKKSDLRLDVGGRFQRFQRIPAFFGRVIGNSAFWLILLTLSLSLTICTGWYLLYRRTVLSFAVTPTVSTTLAKRKELPKHIVIVSQKIDLNVVPATIQDGVWQVSRTDATYLSTSARPGEGGNVVIYGHNLTRIFGKLENMKNGDKISITTNDGSIHGYVVVKKFVVTPAQIEVVLPTDHEMLTLYTCTGLLDSRRLILQALPM